MVEDPLDVFPVWVSLTNFFPCDDSRARCLMSAVRGRTSRWLARRLRRTLQLPTRVSLRVRGHLLPPAEPLALLQPGDTLEAIPAIDGVVDLSREVSPSLPSAPAPRRRARKRRCSEDPSAEPAAALPVALPDPLTSPPAALLAPPPASSPVQGPVSVYEDADAESLVEMKRRALHLLEHHAAETEESGVAVAGGEAGRGRSKRRRRVRRRRPPSAPTTTCEPPPVDTDLSVSIAPSPSPPREIPPGPGPGPVLEASAVLRGGTAGGVGRCVRALTTPSPTPAPVMIL